MDNLAGLLGELVDMFQALAPGLWRILIRQAYVVAVKSVVWIVGGVLLFRQGRCWLQSAKAVADEKTKAAEEIGRREYDAWEDFEWVLTTIFSCGLCVFAVIVVFMFGLLFIEVLINPEYYALKSIIETLTGCQ